MKKRTAILGQIPINDGRDDGDWVEASDPNTGVRVVHAVNRTQRLYDRLHRKGIINDLHHQAAEIFRNTWEAGTLLRQPMARDVGHPLGDGGEREYNSRAWSDHRLACEELLRYGRGYLTVTLAVACHDDPAWSRIRQADVFLRGGLEALYKFYD